MVAKLNHPWFQDNFQYPRIQKIYDALRLTIETATPALLWQTWEEVNRAFNVQGGGVNNKFSWQKINQPPNMHVNALFNTTFNYTMVVELQLHLRAIHRLKEPSHVCYEITRR